MANISSKLKEYFDNKGITQADIALKLGVSKSYVNSLFTGKREFGKQQAENWGNLFGLSPSWLLTGEGSMLKEGDSTPILQRDVIEKGGDNYKLVPLVHIDSVGGMRSKNSISDEPQCIEGYIPFVNAREEDRAIIQSGTSMTPTIPPGSFLQIREVVNWREYFGYGNIFVIELTDGRRITKEVRRCDENPKDYVLCVSHNPDVAPEELPKSMIASVWKVIKVLMDKGW